MSDDEGEALLVIRTARWRTTGSIAVSLIGLAVYAGVLLWVGQIVGPAEFWGPLTDDLFLAMMMAAPGLVMVASLVDAVRRSVWGPTLTLSREGFRIRSDERSRFVKWSDVKQFRVEIPTDSMFPVLGWDHQDDALTGNPIWEGPKWEGHRTTTLDAHLGSGWDGGPHRLCAMLEDWRSRHSA